LLPRSGNGTPCAKGKSPILLIQIEMKAASVQEKAGLVKKNHKAA
jgi:hypothetical protein